MTKKKKVEPVVEAHLMYYGRHIQSSRNAAFAKCICGAVLEGQAEIDEHKLLLDGPSGTNPTARAG